MEKARMTSTAGMMKTGPAKRSRRAVNGRRNGSATATERVGAHVRALGAGLDRAQVVLRRLLAHAGLLPRPEFGELRGSIGVEAGLPERHVDARLRRRRHVGQEGERRVLDVLGLGLVDRAR